MTLDELIALNDELAALTRAGLPLDLGLAELGRDLPGRLGKFANTLAQRTARGEPLSQAVVESGVHVPPVYRAVIEAGLRAGRLPAALEAVATSARRLADTQRAVAIAAIYPLLVVATAWAGLVCFTTLVAPRVAEGFRLLEVPGRQVFDLLAWAGRWAWYWGPVGPVVLLLLAVVWLMLSSRGTLLGGCWTSWLFGRLPWLGRMLQLSRTATFLELLALLVEHDTPLPEALRLAARAAGDRRTLRSAEQLAVAIEHGETPPPLDATFPPLVRWLLLSAKGQAGLLPALRHAAATYERRARHQFDLSRIWMPVFLSVVVGGSVTVLYALLLYAPYTTALRALAR